MKFERPKKSGLISFFFLGGVGNGKSSFSTILNLLLAKKEKIPFRKEWENESAPSERGVTTQISEARITEKYLIVDSPGLNDPHATRSKQVLWQQMIDFLNSP